MKAPLVPDGYAFVSFDEIDSTNEEAKRRANAGESGPLWIQAARQTSGRGRRGRTWESPAGNLMATLLLRPQTSASSAARLSFVAALSVYEIVSAACPRARVTLKWPNDVLIDGKKCAGILLESSGTSHADHLDWLAVGIGINLTYAPTIAAYPATSLKAEGETIAGPEALSLLTHAWAKHFDMWREQGFDPIRRLWLSRAAGIGQEIRVQLPAGSITGRFETLNADGALLLSLPSGETRAITAGEVYFDT